MNFVRYTHIFFFQACLAGNYIPYDATNAPQFQKTYLRSRAPSEDSDQTAHLRSLIRIFTRRRFDRQECKVPSYGQRRLNRLCVCTEELCIHWAHMSEGTFSDVVALILINNQPLQQFKA